ncbi:uncharacterized protein LOC127791786 [Diospyros lotus]|uniref:uncharacterized protein LOC127791786 n=1 Tax=Diospyros lotus TaxID=55363 RepID=UPI0022599FA7|nr:uncharacterized protein LOC127791786 [Diospyros lotus]XP_052177794.1 uncharacterized protein LOC127791786 [Diospyros lotus]
MVSDEDIAKAVESLIRDTNPNSTPFTSLNAVVLHLQSQLGLDLSHKLDFIRNHIHLLLRSPPPPPPQPAAPLPQNPNFHASPHLPAPPAAPPATKREPAAAAVDASAVAPAEAPVESSQTGKKRRGGPGGLNKLCGVSPVLQAIVGQPALPRTEIVKQLWAYIRKNNLQDPSNKRKIICNDELRLVFETDCTDMFKMNKLLAKHIIPLEPKSENAKKQKVEVELGTKADESGPIVIISDALANFFGTTGREMLQSEVLGRVWQYIKVNQLEDPVNAMVIRCDAKLQELLGCASISGMGIPEMLARHHLFKR